MVKAPAPATVLTELPGVKVISLAAVEAAAEALGISVELFDVRRESDIAAAFNRMRQNKTDALYVGIDALTQARSKARSVARSGVRLLVTPQRPQRRPRRVPSRLDALL